MSEDKFNPRPVNLGDGGGDYPLEKFTKRRNVPAISAHAIHERAGRIPPKATEAERAVLGSMMLEKEAVPQAIEVLRDESFYEIKHQHVFGAISHLFENGNPVDLISVTEELRRREKLESVGGTYYLTELTECVASAANVAWHSRIVSEKFLLRKMIETMTTLVGEAYEPSTDAFNLLDMVERDIFSITQNQLSNKSQKMGDVLMETLKKLEAIHGQAGGVTGISSGFTKMDDMTGGWQNSDLIIIAARPSMGKTAFALSICRNAALDREKPTPVAIFSLEMSADQLAQRLLTAEARVDAQSARTGRLSDDDWPKLARAAGRLNEAPIYIDDSPALTGLELRAKCRRLKSEFDIGMVIVDYMQLMQGSKSQQSNREQEIAAISRGLKALAKELNIPVISLAQLSRAVETRGGDKRPMLSDLRESGSIEQDADVVLFIYRAERYGIHQDEDGNSTEGMAEIIIGKQRNGPIGTVNLSFVNRYARFENLTTYYNPDTSLPLAEESGFDMSAPLPPGGPGDPF